MIWHVLPRYPSFTARIEAHYKLILASFLMLGQFAVADLLRATVPVINAFYLEQVLQLVLERN